MTHDTARLSALVDNELDHEARDRVLAHLAQCDDCRAIVESERRVRALIGGLAIGPDTTPSEDFLESLIGLGAAGPGAQAESARVVAAAGRPVNSSRRPTRPSFAAAAHPPRRSPGRVPISRPAGRTRLRRRVVVGVAGAASAVGMTAMLAFAVGGQAAVPTVDIAPPVERFSVEHANTTSDYPLWDPATLSDSLGSPTGERQGPGGR